MIMKIVEVITTDQETRYHLADDTGQPIEMVLQYLKFKDDSGRVFENYTSL